MADEHLPGPLEDAVDTVIEMRRQLHAADPFPPDILGELYNDAVEARELCNRHMGELQRWGSERKKADDARDFYDGKRFERENDPITRPDGQC